MDVSSFEEHGDRMTQDMADILSGAPHVLLLLSKEGDTSIAHGSGAYIRSGMKWVGAERGAVRPVSPHRPLPPYVTLSASYGDRLEVLFRLFPVTWDVGEYPKILPDIGLRLILERCAWFDMVKMGLFPSYILTASATFPAIPSVDAFLEVSRPWPLLLTHPHLVQVKEAFPFDLWGRGEVGVGYHSGFVPLGLELRRL